jgi:hypothetical protein
VFVHRKKMFIVPASVTYSSTSYTYRLCDAPPCEASLCEITVLP